MINLDELELTQWQREDIEELAEEEIPNLFELSNEELDKLSRKYFWEAMSAYNTVQRLESKGDVIACLLRAKKEAGLA